MTSYTISIGYCSEHGAISGKPWEVMVEAVQSITYKELINEYHGPMECEDGCCFSLDIAKNMTTDQGCDSSVIINEKDHTITLLASGGGIQRRMKECMRRAFIRCVMRRADKEFVDVDVVCL